MAESENKRIANNFIISFYNEARVLIGNYANYVNTLAEIGTLTDPSKLEENSKRVFIEAVQRVRSSVSVTYIMLESIKSNLKVELDKEFLETHKKIKNNFVISVDDLEDYLKFVNEILASEVYTNLLESNKDVVNSIYGEGKQQ